MTDIVTLIDKVLQDSGLHNKPALRTSNLHSWECIYTERFGPCTCYDDLVNAIVEAARTALNPCICCSCELSQQDHPYSQMCGGRYGDDLCIDDDGRIVKVW